MALIELLHPQWPAPKGVHAASTLRIGGISQAPFAELNLGSHVGDDLHAVQENRLRLQQQLQLPQPPQWLNQIHTTEIIKAPERVIQAAPDADAIWSDSANRVCAVLTADCLPLLYCSTDGRYIAAAHAGWRGLAAGIVERTLETLPVKAEQVMVWLGAAIGAEAFQVGTEVLEVFVQQHAEDEAAFKVAGDRWLMDIYQLAKNRLRRAGVQQIYGGEHCTFSDERFFSYRRENQTGRMATLIWRSK